VPRHGLKAVPTAGWMPAAGGSGQPWLAPQPPKPAGAMDGPAGAKARMPRPGWA